MLTQPIQQPLPFEGLAAVEPTQNRTAISSNQNSIALKDQPFHNWYRFVLSYPPHLVRDYIKDFGLSDDATILDPFCGTGTTVVEAKLCGIKSRGTEANPFPYFASSVKTDWTIDPDQLLAQADDIANDVYHELALQQIDDRYFSNNQKVSLRSLPPDAMRALIKDSVSPLPLPKTGVKPLVLTMGM